MARTYNSYGGHPVLSLIPTFLLTDAPSFGTSITELTVTFHFVTKEPPQQSLEDLYAKFCANRGKLPTVFFRRGRETMSIDVASNLIDSFGWYDERSVSLPLFRGALKETIEALPLMRPQLTKKDDFHLDAFLNHCHQREKKVPKDEEAMATLASYLKDREAIIRAAMSRWEKLGIDWRDYHPDARRILDDPFYWEQANDDSPHGNDTGADLLSDYRDWLTREPSGNPLEFYRSLIADWGFSADTTDPARRSILDQAAIGLAFAELKLKAQCHPLIAALARDVIRRQRQEALAAPESSSRKDRIEYLDLIEAKLPKSE